MAERTGEIVGERFELNGKLGSGGQSVVFRARDLQGGPDVAVKVMHQKIAQDPYSQARMSREADALLHLKDSAAGLEVFGQYWTEDGCMCIVTELLTGMDLDDYLTAHGERLPVAEVIRILQPVVETLAMANGFGVLHRDLKPGNVFISTHPPGVKLLDFGFAKFTRLQSFTMDGSVAGSPRYIAPEAWLARKDLDERIDVYALATLIFRCLAGHTPFPADTMLNLLRSVTQDPRPSLCAVCPELPPAVDDWVQIALAIDREHRFGNVTAMWNAFKASVLPPRTSVTPASYKP